MKALVTGAAGFIGSAISRRLIAEGHSVIGVDSLSDYYDVAIKQTHLKELISSPHFSFIEEDLNTINFDEAVGVVDYIFHQAGQPGVRRSWGSEFAIYTDANVGATQRLLEWARSIHGLKKFIYASSSSVYGDAEAYPTTETDRPQPLSPYGVSKLAAEHLCTLYAKNFGVPTVSLRYFTVYGPGQRPDMAFTRFVKAAITGSPIQIYGDGEQIRDFTFVDDVVEANVRAATAETPAGVVYNVAGGSNVSMNEVLRLLTELSGNELNVEYVDAVAGDVRRTSGDTSRIAEALGWTPRISLEEGLRHHLAWGRRNFG
ncbi:nucleoside-diphosphate-sugar epimerase [Arthrobacter sp. SLBN-83]|uniref:NAD-dependent epimerase/dehydratase family protein n=1 Tax=Arthrobacter sp. SLBN-83 TaxID=2768449 RepID=UPI001152A440|nr:NAD-dependent epimerase/dehydratase family protein [Arthrobacter sp. SLBN-83]TQJ59913.1 nucleoside-diphosphate-sugar epimerase [Arthrobacter sp. SLBN-83]